MDLTLDDIDLPTLVALAGTLSSSYLLAHTREAGHPSLRASHGYVFQHLINDEPTVGDLASRLNITQQAASKYVRELEQLGYVTRSLDSKDARVRRVLLTESGTDAITASRRARADLDAMLLAEVGAGDVAVARSAVTALLRLTGGVDAVVRRSVPSPDL